MQDNSQGYTKGGYHMLSNNNQVAAKWWSLINNLIILVVHLYVYKYFDSGMLHNFMYTILYGPYTKVKLFIAYKTLKYHI